jgi:hypothetical protein
MPAMVRSLRPPALVALLSVLATPSLAAEPPAQATGAFARAQVAIAGRDCESAVRYLAEAVASAPDYWEAHRSMGECFLALNKPDQARRPLEAALRIKPDDAATRALLARVTGLQKAEAELMAKAIQARDRRAGQPPSAAQKETRPLGDFARNNPSPAGKPGAPDVLRESMRARATSIFRTPMVTVAATLKALAAADHRYGLTCREKGAVARGILTHGAGGNAIRQYRSEEAWQGHFQTDMSRRSDETPACRALSGEIRALASQASAAMNGVDAQLAAAPGVSPDVREEVFARLASELW